MQVTVYMLRCADGSYYVGLTRRPVEDRVGEHNQGLVDGYTKTRRPVELVFSETLSGSSTLSTASGRSRDGRAARRKR